MNDISNLFTKNDKPIVFKLPEDVDKKIFEKRILECGGKITENDNEADMILINQEQKLNVTNHYSMKFVIDSFFWEKLQDEELYKIISSTSTSINSDTILKGIKYNNYNNRKRLRNPFTKNDDNILLSYINNTQLNTSGINLYKIIEKDHPQHTFQSWRSRWVKTLKPMLTAQKKILYINNTENKLNKLYETSSNVNTLKVDSEIHNENVSFDEKKKNVLSFFNQIKYNVVDLYNESSKKKKRKISSNLNDLTSNSSLLSNEDNLLTSVNKNMNHIINNQKNKETSNRNNEKEILNKSSTSYKMISNNDKKEKVGELYSKDGKETTNLNIGNNSSNHNINLNNLYKEPTKCKNSLIIEVPIIKNKIILENGEISDENRTIPPFKKNILETKSKTKKNNLFQSSGILTTVQSEENILLQSKISISSQSNDKGISENITTYYDKNDTYHSNENNILQSNESTQKKNRIIHKVNKILSEEYDELKKSDYLSNNIKLKKYSNLSKTKKSLLQKKK